MEEDELFNEFYVKLKDIVNLGYLAETIPKPKVVRDFMPRSLPLKN